MRFLCVFLFLTEFASLVTAFEKFATMGVEKFDKIQPMNALNGFPVNPNYLVIQSFSDTECTNFIGMVSVILDTCLANSKGSAMYTCANNQATYTNYTDTTCTNVAMVQKADSTCQGKQKLFTCSTNNPLAFGNGEYVAHTFTQDSGCTETLEAVGYQNGYCYKSSSTSSKFEWPDLYVYSDSASCTGAYQSANVEVEGCTYSGASQNDDNKGEYNSFSKYTLVRNDARNSVTLSVGAITGIVMSVLAGYILV